jgi:hypothetical protein
MRKKKKLSDLTNPHSRTGRCRASLRPGDRWRMNYMPNGVDLGRARHSTFSQPRLRVCQLRHVKLSCNLHTDLIRRRRSLPHRQLTPYSRGDGIRDSTCRSPMLRYRCGASCSRPSSEKKNNVCMGFSTSLSHLSPPTRRPLGGCNGVLLATSPAIASGRSGRVRARAARHRVARTAWDAGEAKEGAGVRPKRRERERERAPRARPPGHQPRTSRYAHTCT